MWQAVTEPGHLESWFPQRAARDAAGWHVCLEVLASHLDSVPGPPGSRWAEVHPGYVTSFGPAASAIGVLPGYEPADS